MWIEWPRNEYIRNKGKACNNKGELIFCTVQELEDVLAYDDEDLDASDIIDSENKIDDEVFHFTPT